MAVWYPVFTPLSMSAGEDLPLVVNSWGRAQLSAAKSAVRIKMAVVACLFIPFQTREGRESSLLEIGRSHQSSVKTVLMRIILLLMVLLLCGSSVAQTVTTFEGSDGRVKTETFEVTGPWNLEWDFEGTALRVEIIHADTSRHVGNPIRQAGKGTGSASFQKPGPYYLEIKSVGDYSLKVTQGGQGSAELPTYRGGTERKGTPVLTLPEGWGFRWKFQGPALKLGLYDEGRRLVGDEVKVVGSGSGDRYVGTPGNYFFMIQSSGNYEIELFRR